MAIERNIIFLYPLSLKLKELYKEYEEDDSIMLYEMDSINEYNQLIGILEHSVTFSSDPKKTEQYLNDNKKTVKGNTCKNFFMSAKGLSPLEFSKLQKLGLNEGFTDDLNIKSLKHKVNMFFTPFEQAEKKKDEEKNKAITDQMNLGDSLIGGGKKNEKYSDLEKQRIEKMAILDDKPKHNNQKISELDKKQILGEDSSKLNWQKGKGYTFLDSPFGSLKRKKVTSFNPVTDMPKLKRATFTPQVGVLNKKKQAQFEEVQRQYEHKALRSNSEKKSYERKNSHFEEVQRQFEHKALRSDSDKQVNERKSTHFEEVEKELERKKNSFKEIQRDFNKKRGANFNPSQLDAKKRKKFNEVKQTLEKNHKKIDLIQKEIDLKRNKFKEVEQEIAKRKKLELEETDLEKKKGILLDLQELERKKNALFAEINADQIKQRKVFEEVERELDKEKKLFEDILPELEKKNGLDLESKDYDKKKYNAFESVELDKKTGAKFDEIDPQKKERPSFQDVDKEGNENKKNKFEDIEKLKKKGSFEEVDNTNKKKYGKFEEVKRERNDRIFKELIEKKKATGEQAHGLVKKKEYSEQTIDYRSFKTHKSHERAEKEIRLNELSKKKKLEAILEEPEYNFFDNNSYGLEYLVIYNDFLFKEDIDPINLFKFIHFILMKDYSADFSLYSFREDNIHSLYSGHKEQNNRLLSDDFLDFESKHKDLWSQAMIPTWQDETFQADINEFIFPYVEDGKKLGFAISHFPKTINNHENATRVEVLFLIMKGALLEMINSGACDA